MNQKLFSVSLNKAEIMALITILQYFSADYNNNIKYNEITVYFNELKNKLLDTMKLNEAFVK